ncbi:transcription elongation factor NusA [candidate division MSBL1 archaeon SCGC-AAA261F17]|uniref:Probable transcription termination protein NusA n=3 Tax=candidate division MSBL1 TaxID=215777 RepID=A0A133V1D5_9EURY|nr:transcription elongation factor NusA [candidate division MSBL1 archaeon SCGC-AAA261C02]KXB01204.1 transcription elongation factor NusA [candidate division MSBL1 archaeon SCGC-AAA261F17]KXB04188.1 transcription elongation factor NusA [candidate division MSBL1 archaeon SCGC-AAA261G05]
MKVKLDADKIRKIALFEKVTGAAALDCVESQNGRKLTFVVKEGEVGKAIGKNGRKIRKFRQMLGKSVDIVEHSENPGDFIANVFSSINVKNVEVIDSGEGKIAKVDVDNSEKGKAVGRNGWNIKRARELLARHHGFADVSLT